MLRMTRASATLIAAMFAITALAVPAAAGVHPTQLAIIQGMPGVRVDLCVNGKEIRSGVRYGWKTFRSPDAGSVTLKVFRQDPRKCKGRLIAKRTFDLPEHGDLSIVIARGSPKIMLFDNLGFPPVGPAANPYIVVRHAARAPAMEWLFGEPVGPGPSSGHTWSRGDQIAGSLSEERISSVWVFAGTPKPAGPAKVMHLVPDRRYEVYLIGSKPKNYKQAIFSRPFFPEP